MTECVGASVYHAKTRRELLRIGGLSLFGITQTEVARWKAQAVPQAVGTKRQKNSCVFLFLFGGPSHIDLWDMKPNAPLEIRGEFKPQSTRVPGIQICDRLPRLAQVMDQICLIRSMTHRMNVHGPACSEVFTGREYFQAPTTDEASREDWPSLSSLVMRYGNHQGGMPPSVVLPWHLQFPGQARRIAGQTAGRMNEKHNPFLLHGDLGKADFALEGIQLGNDVSSDRLHQRRTLLGAMQTPHSGKPLREGFDRHCQSVYDLLGNRVGEAFELGREPQTLRESYGQTTVGQSLLMARRLIESGVRQVTVNWQDETKIDGTNTCWDTHQDSFSKLKGLLCPLLDHAFPAFIQDLKDRGLLETTLVVAIGEFGRTPKLGQFSQSNNTKKTGRDHWPHAFTALLAGGGIRGGQVYGATTTDGGYVKEMPVTPADLTATILYHLGIDHKQEYLDEFQRLPRYLSEGIPLRNLG